MPGRRRSRSRIEDDINWKQHNMYDLDSSANRSLTRSQAALYKVKNTKSDMDLFADANRHHPPGLPHLMVALKGPFGAVPNTIITSSSVWNLGPSQEMCDRVDIYKKSKLSSTSRRESERRKRAKTKSSRRRG